MIIIGFLGKPGSGKTELSKHLMEEKHYAYINVDSLIFGDRKLNTLSRFLIRALDLNNAKSKNIENKRAKFNKMLDKLAKKEVLRYKKEKQHSILLVDYVRLNQLKSVYKMCDYKILILRSEENRINGIRTRAGHSGGNKVVDALKGFTINIAKDLENAKVDYIIENSSTLSKLYKAGEDIILKIQKENY